MLELLSSTPYARGDDVILATGVGQHQMWAMQYLACERTTVVPHLGRSRASMGFGVPAAVGAAAARPGRRSSASTATARSRLNRAGAGDGGRGGAAAAGRDPEQPGARQRVDQWQQQFVRGAPLARRPLQTDSTVPLSHAAFGAAALDRPQRGRAAARRSTRRSPAAARPCSLDVHVALLARSSTR